MKSIQRDYCILSLGSYLKCVLLSLSGINVISTQFFQKLVITVLDFDKIIVFFDQEQRSEIVYP
ncbi:hypothetical protein CASFOL_038223 [Castilleja foliolosa]|uniref:Uncharacterized protein n=1 Tax=Castilleja foliolosa TaxID=1961234 RepID=A0ABD3BKV2_9LAMI